MSECAFCGHPNSNHRIVDAIISRIDAGEPEAEVFEDYGYTPDGFDELLRCVYPEVWLR